MLEAAVRLVYKIVMGVELPRLELDAVRGLNGTKEAVIPLHNQDNTVGLPVDLRIAVVNGLGNAKKLIKRMKAGEVQYDFVEVMACPGGCINGGGQPKGEKESAGKRLQVIYNLDKALPIRLSYDNDTVKRLYMRSILESLVVRKPIIYSTSNLYMVRSLEQVGRSLKLNNAIVADL